MQYDRLDSELWLIELSEIIDECEGASPEDEGRILSKLHALLTIAPKEWSQLFDPLPDKQAFASLLDIAAFESAAIQLLGEQSGYMLSRSANGAALASVWLPSAQEEIHAKATSEAIALINAFASAVFCTAGEQLRLKGSPSFGMF